MKDGKPCLYGIKGERSILHTILRVAVLRYGIIVTDAGISVVPRLIIRLEESRRCTITWRVTENSRTISESGNSMVISLSQLKQLPADVFSIV